MKAISQELQDHLNDEVMTLCTMWRLERRDGVVLGFTDLDRDIVFDGLNFVAASGFMPTMIESGSSLAVDNLDVEGLLDSSGITEADLLAGKYDYAEIEIFKINYEDASMGKITLRQGWLGEITIREGKFVAEIRGLMQKLNNRIGELYSPGCRANLGDARCKVSMTGYTRTGSVTATAGRQSLTDTARLESTGFFNQGLLTFISGLNAGLSMEVREFSQGNILLTLPMPFDIAVGNSYTITAGCDKNFQTCVSRFNNAVNFRGEPHVPGTDKILETAGTRSN